MITTLTGDNGFLVRQTLDKQVAAYLKNNDELGLERLDGEEASFERLQEAMLATPMFASNKLVVIKNADKNKELLEQFEHIFDAIPETTEVILVIPKVDKRAKYAKVLQKKTDYQEFGAVDSPNLARWLVDTAKQKQATISLSDAQYLVERVGTNQAILGQEIDKLILHDSKITREIIDNLTEPTPQSTVFELLDAAFAGNTAKALRLYEEQRRLKVEPLAILGMIAWQLHILAIVATAKDKNQAEVAKEARIHPFVINKSKATLRKLSFSRLKQLIEDALTLDIRLKSESIEADDALKHYLLSLAIS